MWFKRKKRPDQDRALSQSLRSLQTLLNETDRREPSLDAGHDGPDEPGPDTTTRPVPEALKPRITPPLSAAGERDAFPREPAAPDSASRWRDLSLSFDAEPEPPPRPRRDTEAGPEPGTDTGTAAANDAQTTDAAPETDEPAPATDQGDEKAAAGPLVDDSGAEAQATNLDEPESNEPALRSPPDDAGDDPAAGDDAYAGGGPAPRTPVTLDHIGPDTLLEPRLAAVPTDPAAFPDVTGPDDESAEADAPEWDEPVLPDVESETGAPEATGDEQAEDQLPLDLEPADQTDDDIPTLTEAVYVPAMPAQPPGAEDPEPNTGVLGEETEGPPSEGSIDWCLEQLRNRLEALEEEPLTAEQEAQLRDTLSVMLDYLRADAFEY